MTMSCEEQLQIKENLALAYRACAHLKLDDLTYTHLSARACTKSFYLYSFGLMFQEVSAQNLLRISHSGDILEGQEMNYNPTGYALHSMIYEHKPKIGAIFHLHTPAIVAVSSLKQGLKPVSQWALHFYNNVAYHDYNSLALDKKVYQKQYLHDLGSHPVMLMRHHGAMVVGETIEQALFYCYHLEKACQTQCLLQGVREEQINSLDSEICERAHRDLIGFEKNLGQRDFQALKRVLSEKKSCDTHSYQQAHSLEKLLV